MKEYSADLKVTLSKILVSICKTYVNSKNQPTKEDQPTQNPPQLSPFAKLCKKFYFIAESNFYCSSIMYVISFGKRTIFKSNSLMFSWATCIWLISIPKLQSSRNLLTSYLLKNRELIFFFLSMTCSLVIRCFMFVTWPCLTLILDVLVLVCRASPPVGLTAWGLIATVVASARLNCLTFHCDLSLSHSSSWAFVTFNLSETGLGPVKMRNVPHGPEGEANLTIWPCLVVRDGPSLATVFPRRQTYFFWSLAICEEGVSWSPELGLVQVVSVLLKVVGHPPFSVKNKIKW